MSNVVIDAFCFFFCVPFHSSISLLLGLAEIAAHSMLMLVSFLSQLARSRSLFLTGSDQFVILNSKLYLYRSQFHQNVAQIRNEG